jgi:predicted GH43/DUF377 family glycosyl hydrolase
MRNRIGRDVIHRWEGNPIITLEDIPFRCNTVFNAGAVKFGSEYILLLRVEDLLGRSVFALARGRDGYHFTVESEPVLLPEREEEPFRTYEARGIEDPRITQIDDKFYVMYTAVSRFGARLALAETTDFHEWRRVGLVSEPENKDGVLFPKKIDGKYVRLDRPVGNGTANVWISYSTDLIHWGDSRVVFTTRGGLWDTDRVGASAPPIETSEGWLEIYHGVKNMSAGPVYRLGAVLLDLEDPSKVISRSSIPILVPREYYERVGDVGNVVFSCGCIPEPDGEILVYYGASDTCICVGTANTQELIQRCHENGDGVVE